MFLSGSVLIVRVLLIQPLVVTIWFTFLEWGQYDDIIHHVDIRVPNHK